MSNFTFLRTPLPSLHTHATKAETLIPTAPRAACFYTRFALEQSVLWLYENDPHLRFPYENGLYALIHERSFKNAIDPRLFSKLDLIRRKGNDAVHKSRPISENDARYLVGELFHVLYWLCRTYTPNGNNLPNLTFAPAKIPQPSDPTEQAKAQALSQQQLKELAEQLAKADERSRIETERRARTEAELEAIRAEVTALKAANAKTTDPHDYNEANTRRLLIDEMLREAGWNPSAPNAIEFEVEGMPTDSGNGKVDYVLWDDNGKPLALIEAKRTSKSPQSGQHQAKLYADCLEARYSQRPVIFFSNGYETWLWDDTQYPPRQVLGFLKKEELQRILFRRSNRKRFSAVAINENIAGKGRPYQKEAIRRITDTFEHENRRKALLVMATGTGKTRTAIALIDLLKRANWVNRVLFLADRKALLRQAFRAFKAHLPTVTAANLLEKNHDFTSANVVLSTYKTMLNAIDRHTVSSSADTADFSIEESRIEKLFGVGYFDLIVVDEAHRSIYKKYGEIFDYFDGLLVGLTATPRAEVDRDTYRIFDLPQGNPTFTYELDDAIQDGHLVPPRAVNVPFKFLRTGVKYSDLSPEEQREYEEKFRDEETGELPSQINAAALNKWLFNISTVEQALELVMNQGLKVDGGDRLGKTIIFARNHKHAEFIATCFDSSYPQYNGHFAQIIDSHDSHAQSLLDDFSEPNKMPIIAISVDMLDTGVDVPEILNLVFFKPVFSRVKFNQMIGRGTRQSENLLGPNKNKEEFLIFDLCGNCLYFDQDIQETEKKLPETLTTRLVKHRLELAQALTPATADTSETTTPETTSNPTLRNRLLDDLHHHVSTMPRDNFMVRRHLRDVGAFSERDRWNTLTEADTDTINRTLATLPNGITDQGALAKEFDLLCLKLQLALLKKSVSYERLRDQVRDTLSQLESNPDHPLIKPQLSLIQAAQAESYWTDATPEMVEDIRLQIRELVKFIDREKQEVVITDFADEMGDLQEVDVPTIQTGFSPYQYKRKVEAYIRENEDHIAIAKLKRNRPLTDADLSALEDILFSPDPANPQNTQQNRQRFEEVFGKHKSLKLLIREMVGLDRAEAKTAFAHYLEGTTFSANQIRFVENIIDYLTQNGTMDPGLLFEAPFTDTHTKGLSGVFNDTEALRILKIVNAFNITAGADFTESETVG
ncbi:MAG: DEAD/DEAH box helicase family protein [Phormidesmis sp.]